MSPMSELGEKTGKRTGTVCWSFVALRSKNTTNYVISRQKVTPVQYLNGGRYSSW